MRRSLEAVAVGAVVLLTFSGCTGTTDQKAPPAAAANAPAANAPAASPPLAASTRSLASFAKSNTTAPCFDRAKEPCTAVVDAHFHPRPFGGQAIPPSELFEYLDKAGVRFVNYFGIGQSLDLASSCTYYLDCPGISALPSIKNDAEPTRFVPLMKHVLEKYPDNKIVWAHMGLSKELTRMDPAQHIAIMKAALDSRPNLMLDISWDVLYNAYHEYGAAFVRFFNEYPDRILPGSDFVAARNKKPESDDAFRKIALGENYFRLMNLDYRAPEICR